MEAVAVGSSHWAVGSSQWAVGSLQFAAIIYPQFIYNIFRDFVSYIPAFSQPQRFLLLTRMTLLLLYILQAYEN